MKFVLQSWLSPRKVYNLEKVSTSLNTTQYFIQPLDVLYLRGNKLFGDPGSYGKIVIPPWPSVFAGAIRTSLICERGYDPIKFGKSEITNDPELGTPENPGTFKLTGLQLAKRSRIDNQYEYEKLFPLPNDLVVFWNTPQTKQRICRMKPCSISDQVLTSSVTPCMPVLARKKLGKPSSILYYLDSSGWSNHLNGNEVLPERIVSNQDLWKIEDRIGIGLNANTRSVNDGNLFTTQAVSMRKYEHGGTKPFDAGFVVEIAGAELPDKMIIKLGGDGRGAILTKINQDDLVTGINQPTEIFSRIKSEGKCRIILTSPGIFPNGWTPTNSESADTRLQFEMGGITATLDCAAVSRPEVISGFDMANNCPKPALRVAPTGSVYWLNNIHSTTDLLVQLVQNGLWTSTKDNPPRQVEGFNRFVFATY